MAAIDETQRQTKELWWVEFAQKYRPGSVPVGKPERLEPPAPDVVFNTESGRIGIELSQIVPRSYGRYNDPEIEAAQKCAVKEAQAFYWRRYKDDLFVNFNFSPGVLPARRELVAAMTELVARHRPPDTASFSALPGSRNASTLLPSWLRGLSIFHQLDYLRMDWTGGSVWSTSTLRYEQVVERIGEKASKLAGYRAFADEVWLLLVCDQFSISASVSIPHAAAEWKFQHPFDRVVLMSMQEFFIY
ncbi:hypothetical protein [Lysobacter capsici]|uniref:hypothetical protein n=1 Tax=Lysobacter capsici TaxID=435897 RepID=UPI000A59A893|nr:hypothetical protein [Lysobacter capsici]